MYTKKVYPALGMMQWTKYESLVFIAIGLGAVLLSEVFGLTWIKVP
ncbi:MAG: hypothetical protein ACI9O4_002232 [Chitinophagales bacterium]|jgi:hypothetical protein